MAAVERTLVAPRAQRDAAIVAFAVAAFAVVSLVWLGVLLGVSFLATPVKFLAPTLTMPVALDVGRHTFHWLNRAEIVLALVTFASALAYEVPRRRALRAGATAGAQTGTGIGGAGRPYAALLGGFLLVAVALQGLWLLPLLDARIEVIIQGGTPPSSPLHDVYVVLEAAKLAALVGAGWLGIASLRAAPRA